MLRLVVTGIGKLWAARWVLVYVGLVFVKDFLEVEYKFVCLRFTALEPCLDHRNDCCKAMLGAIQDCLHASELLLGKNCWHSAD